MTGLAGAMQVQRTSSRGSVGSPKANVSVGVMSVQPHQMNHSLSFYPENYYLILFPHQLIIFQDEILPVNM